MKNTHDVFNGSWLQGVAVGIGLGYIHTQIVPLPGWALIIVMSVLMATGAFMNGGSRFAA